MKRVKYPLKARLLEVTRFEDLSPDMRRIYLSGPELENEILGEYFSPADHVNLSIPHPETGEIVLPEIIDGKPQRPADAIFREYTIRDYDAETGEIAFDFVLHDHGPAGNWAINVKVGDKLGVVGPRGRMVYETDFDRYVLAADETALPAFERWIAGLSGSVTIDGFVIVNGAENERQLPNHPGLNLRWVHRSEGQELADGAISVLPEDDGKTYLWAAAETTSLLPLRAHLKEINFDRKHRDIRGYWKQGDVAHKDTTDMEDMPQVQE